MDLLSYIRILRRRWVLILAVVIGGASLGAVTGVLDTSSKGATYHKATHVLFFDGTVNSGRSSTFANLDQIALFTVSGDVPDRVGKELGEDGRVLAEHVIVTTNSVTATLEITAAADTARTSEEIADTFAAQLMASISEREETRFEQDRDRVIQRLDSIQAEINSLDAQIAASAAPSREITQAQRNALVNQYRLTYEQFQQLAETGAPTPPLTTLEVAESVPIGAAEYDSRLRRGELGENLVRVGSTSEDSGSDAFTASNSTFDGPVSRGVLGGFLGLLGGVGLALVAERLDRRLRTREEVEYAYGVAVLAEVPRLTAAEQRDDAVVSYTEPLSRTAEAHRAVRSSVLFQHAANQPANADGVDHDTLDSTALDDDTRISEHPLVVLVTSALPNEGKSTTSANLAAVFAESGDSVLAVNCDFRRPSLHRLLGAPDEARRVLETSIPGVKLVSGVATNRNANPAKIIAAQRRVVAAARDRFDVIVLDTAPILTTNDAIEVMGSVDFVVLVARPEVTTGDAAARARNLLERVHAPVAGIVLVGDESVASDPYYYYSRTTGQEPVGTTEAPTGPDGEPAVNGAGSVSDADEATDGVFGDDDVTVGEGIPIVEVDDDGNGHGDLTPSSAGVGRATQAKRVRWKGSRKASKRSS